MLGVEIEIMDDGMRLLIMPSIISFTMLALSYPKVDSWMISTKVWMLTQSIT